MTTKCRIGLTGRSIAFCVAMILCTVGLVSAVLIQRNHTDSIQRVREHALGYARAISDTAEPAVLLNEPKTLDKVARAAGGDPAIAIVEILDAKGKTLALFKKTDTFVRSMNVNPVQPLPGPVDANAFYIEQTDAQLLVVVPIWKKTVEMDLGIVDAAQEEPAAASADGVLGYLCLHYSLAHVQAERISRLISSGLISIVVVLVGIAATVAAVRQLVRPIVKLVETTSLIAKGDLTRRAPEDAMAEIGCLARSFNHMADRLQDSYQSIERKVEERTTALREAVERAHRLADAAEAASRAKSEFLANMSHELRTPLTAILGYTEVLLDDIEKPEQLKQHIQIIHRNGEHLLGLINDILDISKIEAGKMEMDAQPCSVQAAVADVLSMMRVRAAEKNLDLSVRYSSPIPETVTLDEARLRQCLVNLVGNAIKFTDKGGVLIDVGCITGPVAMLRFDVMDSGIGIDADTQKKLFQPFVQGDSSTSRKYGGTGLGLTITRRIVEGMGGEISVQSSPGHGSTFRIRIPVGTLEGVRMVGVVKEAVLPPRQESPSVSVVGQQLGGLRILLAEDGPDNQKLISLLLRRAGAEVTLAENGLEAVQNATTSTYDLILMDMQMPELDGYQATARLRAAGKTLPIIALTAHALSGDRDKCLAAGCTDYLTKPIDRQALIERVVAYTIGRKDSSVATDGNSGVRQETRTSDGVGVRP